MVVEAFQLKRTVTRSVKVGSDVENIKGTATLKVAEYTEKTSNACAPNVQMNYLKQK